MTLWQTLALAVALGIDCLGVSTAMALTHPGRTTVILSCLLFGVFQSGMALAGMLAGSGLSAYLSSPLRFVAPTILAALGVLMIIKWRRSGHEALKIGNESRAGGIILILGAAVAVSIDALGAGVALGLIGEVSLIAVTD